MTDSSRFREQFPELSGATDAQIAFWLDLAAKRLNAKVWADLHETGCLLFAAHNLARLGVTAESGGAYDGEAIDAQGSLVASKSVEKVSISYDNGTGSIAEAGEWNSTRYGRQFYELMMIVGVAGSVLYRL